MNEQMFIRKSEKKRYEQKLRIREYQCPPRLPETNLRFSRVRAISKGFAKSGMNTLAIGMLFNTDKAPLNFYPTSVRFSVFRFEARQIIFCRIRSGRSAPLIG